MSKNIVFDIETYRPDWRIRRPRREDLDPAKNTVITVGFFDGKEMSIYPTIENLGREKYSIQFLLSKLKEVEGSTLVGYNILHFDIPYLIHKSKSLRKEINIAEYRLLDLYWTLPYWLHNVPGGRRFFDRNQELGNLWRLSDVVKHILKQEPNPFSNTDVFQLWDDKRFRDIQKHLELDLNQTFSFLKSPIIQEALNHIGEQELDKRDCADSCPYQQLLQMDMNHAICYCTLLQTTTRNIRKMEPIDVIDYPLPRWDVSWIPPCL